MQNPPSQELNKRHRIVNSLPVRAFFAVVVITSFAVITAISSGLLAWIAESDAKAINTAGSIRMATYRINYLLATQYQTLKALDQNLQLTTDKPVSVQLSEDMQARLSVLAHYEQLQGNQDAMITKQIADIEQTWNAQLKPLLLANDSQQFFLHSTHYINSVDKLVKQIQQRNEKRQNQQQTLQMVSLLITIIIMLVGLFDLQQNVLIPVKQLRRATQQFRKGLNTQVHIHGYEEFNELGRSFNDMTRTIKAYQDNLEAEVARKTYHLTQSNQALTLLYGFAKEVRGQHITYAKLQRFISQFSQIVPHLHLTLCLHNELHHSKDVISLQSEMLPHRPSNFCQAQHCDACPFRQQHQTWIYPIHSHHTEWGELIVTPKDSEDDSLVNWQLASTHDNSPTEPTQRTDALSFNEAELLNTLANLIAIVFASQKQREQEHKLILFEERNTIARELHDSLAQSLSYLKMQIALLANLLKQQDDTHNETHQRIEQVMSQTKDGLNDAYSQLRELLVTFRLKIDEGDFDTALDEASQEFSQKGGFSVHLDNRIVSSNLTANEQVDLLQITREALSNINRHANAQHANVTLTQNQQGYVTLRVQDDGVGLSHNFDHRQHHGLKIMQERSHNLGGDFRIDNVLPRGTAITVRFMPKLFEKTVL